MNILELNRAIWGRFLFCPCANIYIIMLKIPIIPNKRKMELDKISIVLVENFEPNHFPKKMALESLASIPQIDPQISGNL